VQTAPGLPRIETDSGQVEQVVMNLILNALESIPKGNGGAVFVRTYEESGTEKPSIVLEVRDSGIGMDAETQARIFDPFFTTKFTGRGLGLAAVQGILRSSGGSIDVNSSPGKGSTFRVHFPAVGSNAPTSPAKPVSQTQPVRESAPAVLVIDDEPSVRQTCRLALEKAGCTVYLAGDGEQGLRCLEEMGDEIGIMLLDLGMPDMNGRQVLERVRASGRSLPVVVLSGYGEREVAREFEGLDVSAVLQKPFVASRLTDIVAEVLNRTPVAARS
jgi:CheY-like chemotaxis protein